MERQSSTGGAIGVVLFMASLMIGMVAFIFSITSGRGPEPGAVDTHLLPTNVDRQKVTLPNRFKPERIQND